MNIIDGVDGADGVVIVENIVEYAVSSSGTIIPGGPLSDENGNALYDSEGFLSVNAWHEEILDVAPGEYLWTRTTTTYSDGTKGVSYSVARNGQNPYTVVLSNESHTFPASTEAAIPSTAICDIIAYDGQEALIVNVGEITGMPEGMSVEVQGNDTKFAKFIVTVNENMVTQNGTLTIPIRINEFEFLKFFTYSLALTGQGGVVYRLHLSSSVLSKTGNGYYNPPTITVSATQQEGSGSATPYSGRFRIEITEDNINWTIDNESESDESSKIYAMPQGIAAIKVTLYKSGGFDDIIDYQTIPVVSDGADGNGIFRSIVEYAISDSGTVIPGGPFTDGNDIIFDDFGAFSNSVWSTELPENVPLGLYLWTRTTLLFSDGEIQVSYSVGRNGQDGLDGQDGAYIVREIPLFYISTSKKELINGNWTDIQPEELEEGQYLWKRFQNIMSDGTVMYSDPYCETVMGGITFLVNELDRSITSKIWETDITNTLNEYDNTIAQSIRDRVNETVTDVNGIHTTISDIQSSVFGDDDTSIVKRIHTVEDTASGHTTTIGEIQGIINDGILGDNSYSVKTIAQQAADHFSWLVTSSQSDTATTFVLTDRAVEAAAEKINARGLVTFEGLDSATQKKIDDAQNVLTNIKGGIVSSKMEYCQSSQGDTPPGGVLRDGNGEPIYDGDGNPLVDGLWTETIPTLLPGQYLWVRMTTEYSNGEKDVEYIALMSGTDGLNPILIVPYWYLGTDEPTTTPLTNKNQWSMTIPEYEEGKTYWQCDVTTYNDGSQTCSKPVQNNAYNEAISKSYTAVSVANQAKTTVDNYTPFVSNAKTILEKWTGDATLGKTTINGAWIDTGTITADHLATDAIMSKNYAPGIVEDGDMKYSSAGSFLDLATGNFYTPNFSVSGDKAYLNGEIVASSGVIGDPGNSYWQIGTTYDANWVSSAALISHGQAHIQTGKLTLSDERLSTINNGNYIYHDGEYYDYALQVPDREISSSNIKHYLTDNFLYIRKISSKPSAGTLENAWTYLFKVDKDGNIWEGGEKLSDKYMAKSGGNSFLPLSGGTITGNLTVNGTLTATASTASKLVHKLRINGTDFDGSADVELTTASYTVSSGSGITVTSSNNTYKVDHSNSVTAGSAAGSTDGTILANGGDFYIPVINYDSNGHITTVSSSKITLPLINAGQDDQGHDISTTYVQINGNQEVNGEKRFTGITRVTNTTASTSKSTGALQVSGGAGIQGRMSANEVEIGNKCVLRYSATTSSVDFVFN